MNSDKPRSPRARGGIAALTLLVCVMACWARPQACVAQAQSQPEPAASSADASAYRELIEQALNEFKHKNWPEARVLFRRAHELSPSARTLRGMGVVSYEMRDYVHAVLELSAALVDTRQTLTDAQRKECETLLARSRTFVGAFTLKLEPSSADVTLDGAPLVHDADGRVLVSFGEHSLRAGAPGFQDSISKLAVQGGEQGELRIVLYRPQALAAAPTSSVEKTVTREAPSPAPQARVQEASQPAKKGFMGGGIRYGWVALGTGAALGAAAAATWFIGQGKVDDLDSRCERQAAQDMPCLRGNVDTGNVQRFEKTTTALLGLTGAAVIAAGVLFTLEWPSERQSERKLALDVAPQRLSVRGNF